MPLSVGLVQLNSSLSWSRQRFQGRRRRAPLGGPPSGGEPTESWSIFPYSVGLLEAYARSHAPEPERYRFRPALHRPLPIDEAMARLSGADVVGFSTYVWNERQSLAIAERLKRVSPSTLVVFGGPQVPDHPAAWLAEHPQVDVTVHGEGEAAFLELLESHGRGGWEEVASLSWRGPHGVVTTPRRARIADLDRVPSPYLSGVFEPLMLERPEERWILLWETNRGCPFSCTFCDWGSATASKVFRFGMERLEAELEWFGSREGELIFCCDANFGILPRDVELARLAARTKRRHGFPRTLSVQNTKNATERAYAVHSVLAEAAMHGGVTLALQSLDETTLAAVSRANISLDSFRELQRRFRRDGIPTYSDVILALPGETFDSFADGVGRLIAEGQHTRVQFYNCAILPNAPMAAPAYRREHGLVTKAQRLLASHLPLDHPDDGERIETVVATRAMPEADWRRAKVFSWYADLLHFDRLLHLPFVVAHASTGVGFRTLIGAVMEPDPDRHPELVRLRARLDAHARSIGEGGPEPIAGPEWLGLWWPPDQWALVDLVTRFAMEGFYREAEDAVRGALARHALAMDDLLLSEAFRLNHALLAQPFEIDDLALGLERDVWGAYQRALDGDPLPAPCPARGTVVRTRPVWMSWEGWLEQVTFCHNQKTSYLWPWRAGHDQSAAA